MRQGSMQISKRDFYARGGFANPRCWRRQLGRSGWTYYYRYD